MKMSVQPVIKLFREIEGDIDYVLVEIGSEAEQVWRGLGYVEQLVVQEVKSAANAVMGKGKKAAASSGSSGTNGQTVSQSASAPQPQAPAKAANSAASAAQPVSDASTDSASAKK
ncbi:MAG TPA: hypothetical protein VE986_00225 [Hyphomicrobiales bacterium]|nr:hypothetical protein [Hyphomicrobiales bacterium]